MAREIDFGNLGTEDFQYLSDRHWLIAEGDAQGFETSKAIQDWRDGVEAAPAEDEEFDLNDLTVKELQAELKARDLPTSGSKEELIARLIEASEADDEEDDEEEDA